MKVHVAEIPSTDLSIVRDLSHAIWPICYANIITEAQIKYMLENMYSLPALEKAHIWIQSPSDMQDLRLGRLT